MRGLAEMVGASSHRASFGTLQSGEGLMSYKENARQ